MAFSDYSPLTIDHTKVSTNDQTNFPVLVSLTDARFKTVGNGGHVQNSNGYDIRFYSNSILTTALDYELDTYNGTTGAINFWVRIPTLSHTVDTVIYIAYGDSSIVTDGSSTTTWNSNYIAVYHFGDGTTLSYKDSTGNGFGLKDNGGATTPVATTGQIGGAISLDGSNQFAYSTNFASWTAGDHSTFQAWIHSTIADTNFREIIRMASASPFLLQNALGDINYTSGGGSYNNAGQPNTTTGNHFSVGTNDNSNTVNYWDGAVVNTRVEGAMGAVTAPICIGSVDGTGSQLWSGWIDEARVVRTVLGADWITTEYNNQNSPSTFETLGSEVPLGDTLMGAMIM